MTHQTIYGDHETPRQLPGLRFEVRSLVLPFTAMDDDNDDKNVWDLPPRPVRLCGTFPNIQPILTWDMSLETSTSNGFQPLYVQSPKRTP